MRPCESLDKLAYTEIDITAAECASCIFAALGNHDIEKTTHINDIPEARSDDLEHYESYALRRSDTGLVAKIISGVVIQDEIRSTDSSVYFTVNCAKLEQ